MTQNRELLSCVCIFCLKLTTNVTNDNINAFFKFLGRFLRNYAIQDGIGLNIHNERLSCCKDCKVIIDSFCDLYNQLKCVELKLEWRLGSLLNIMKLANRVPSRVQQVKCVMMKRKAIAGNETVMSEHNRLKAFRAGVIGKCSKRLSNSYPKVLIEREPVNPKNIEAPQSCHLMEPKREIGNTPSGTNDSLVSSDGLEVFSKFLTSFVAVVLLAPDLSMNCSRFIEQETAHLDDLEDIVMDAKTNDLIDFATKENKIVTVKQSEQILQNDLTSEDSVACSSVDYQFVTENDDNKALFTPPISKALKTNPFYDCHNCSKTFRRRISLANHKATEHFASPLTKFGYNCSSCKTPFRSNAKLQIHKLCSQIHKIKRKQKYSNSRTTHSRRRIHITVNSLKPVVKIDPDSHICTINSMKEKPQPTNARYNLRERRKPGFLKMERECGSNSIEVNYDPANMSDSELSSASSSESETRSNASRIILKEPKVERIDDETRDKKCHKKIAPTQIKNSQLSVICPEVLCTKRFKTNAQLECHQKLHGTFNCKFCNVSKDYAPNLAIHEAEVHSFRSSEEANKTERKDFNLWNCSRCLEDFRRKSTLVKHFLKDHLIISSMGHTCSICKAEFSTQNFHRAHFRINHKTEGLNPSEIHNCDKCQAYFIQKTQLTFHTFSFHYKNKCPECGKECSKPQILLRHIQDKHPKTSQIPNSTFICDIGNCKRQCLTPRGLEMHQKSCRQSQEEVDKKVKCTKCEKEFATKRQLYNHNSVYHNHENVCPDCGKSFTSRRYFKIHMHYHKGPDAWILI